MADRLILVCDGAAPEAEAGACLLSWNENHSTADVVSLPEWMNGKLLQIRSEHMRWAYETGLTVVEGKPSQTLADYLLAGPGPSMWWTSLLYERHPKISPCLYDIYRLRALELFLEEKGVRELELRGADRRLAKTLEKLCQSRGISFSAKGPRFWKRPESWAQFFYRLIPAPLRALLRYGHWWLTVRRKLPPVKSLAKAAPAVTSGSDELAATIVSYFPNIDLKAAASGHYLSRYWESLHGALNEEARRERPAGGHFVRWLFIRFPSPQLSFRQCRDLCKLFRAKAKDGLSFNYLEEFLSFRNLLNALKGWLALCFKSVKVERQLAGSAHFKGSSLNFWTYVKWDWGESARGWRCLERALQNEAFISYFRLAGKQRWTLFPLENCPWERMLTLHARSIAGTGPVYGAQHSIVRPTDFRYFDDPRTFSDGVFSRLQPDVIGANGQSSLEQWLENGMPEDRSRQLEALRYLYLEREGSAARAPSREIPGEGEPLEPGAPRHLLVLTSFFQDETVAHLRLLEETLKAGSLNDWQISIKAHPALSVEPWLLGLPADLRQKIMLVEMPLAVLFQSWQLVWTSNSTTASLEAALKGLPLMVMAAENDFDLCPIQNVRGLVRTANLEDVRKGLEMARPLKLPADYLDLSPGLQAWKKLLGFI